MTHPQLLSVATLLAMMALFIWGRFRYDVTAIIALLAALSLGLVQPKDAFKGFADDIVIIVGSALVISTAVQRSGMIEVALALVSNRLSRVGSQLLALTGLVGVASGLVKNVGALAMLMPAAMQMAKKTGTNPSVFLMPMSFASLLGGLMTLVGTSPNIIVSRVREEMTGRPFGMFDFFPTGFGLLLVGLLFLRFGYRLLPGGRVAAPTIGEALDIKGYVTEATVEEGSAAIGDTIQAFLDRHDHEVTITGLVRGGLQTFVDPRVELRDGDTLILGGDPDALQRVISADGLALEGHDRELPVGTKKNDIGVLEAVVTTDSVLIGQAAGRMQLQQRHGVNLIAVSRAGQRLTRKLGEITLNAGDVIVLQGPLSILPERLRDLGALPLAERSLRLGGAKGGWLPILILGIAMIGTASGYVPVAAAFFAAAGLILVSGTIPLRDAYAGIEWPILIMLGALIPVADTLRTTGAANVLATELATVASVLPPWGAVALILTAAMAVTPFLNNAATVLVMAPIAAVFANDLGYRPEPFLIATAIGAGCDFLSPIGHQCNTLVFGPGGYKFSDYARLGLPLSLLVILIGTPLIVWTWPIQ